MTPHRPGLPRLPALDGLRGVAVLAVVLFHADGLLRGGYLGVDLFFVLSGFLITANLRAEWERSGRVDLTAFWVRRARRLLPALVALMPAIALYALTLAKPDELRDLRADALATLTYVSNWRALASERSYWALFAARSPLEHTWSLSIEEQYYLVWPLLVAAAVRFARDPRKALVALTGLLLLASVTAALLLFDGEHTSRVYFGTDTRAGAILLGALFALVRAPGRTPSLLTQRLVDAAGLVALALLAAAWLRVDGQDPRLYRGGFFVTEIGYVALVACATAAPAGVVSRLFCLTPLRFLGTLSYGIYLWHWPVACVLAVRPLAGGSAMNALAYGALTVALAVASYRLLEQPIVRGGLRLPRPAFATASLMALAYGSVDAATRHRERVHDAQASEAAAGAPRVASDAALARVDSKHFPAREALPPGTLRVLVLGDSVAEKLGQAMRREQTGRGVFVAERGVGNCSIMESFTMDRFDPYAHPSPTTGCAARWVADVAELQPDVTFVAIGGGFLPKMTIAGRSVDACTAAWAEAYGGRLKQLFREMGPHAGRVVLATAAYPIGRAEEVWRHPELSRRVDCFNAIVRDTARTTGVAVADLGGHLCPTAACIATDDGVPIRPDGLHPDGPGARGLARWAIEQVGATR